jgi:pimeloyl-ACP methyl ester carboxylesterase
MVPASQGLVAANGIRIAYESFGPEDREVVLLIMGASSQLTMWPLEIVETLVSRGYRVIRYDHRDVGLSTHADAAGMPDFAAVVAAAQAGRPAPLPYTLRDLAEDAVGLLDALGIEKAHLAGTSMGGMIAQIMAAEHPTRTLSLTSIMATSGKPGLPLFARPEVVAKVPPPAAVEDRQGYLEYRVEVLRLIGSERAPIDERVLRAWVARDVERSYDPMGEARHAAASLFGAYEDRRAGLATIAVPTVVVHGEDDPLIPLEASRDVAANVPHAELRIVPGLGHVLHPARLEDIADAIATAAARAGHSR